MNSYGLIHVITENVSPKTEYHREYNVINQKT